jgi:hypothetical protein
VTTISANAFCQDTKLKTFTIPASVTSIGSEAFSYPTTTTVFGVEGSYAESYAKWKSFVDITQAATGITLANGTSSLTIGRSQTVTPKFTWTPGNATDAVVSLSSDNTSVTVKNGTQLYGSKAGTANITATTFGGSSYTFTVTVDTLSGIEIASVPNKTTYGLKEDKDLSGLVVNAVFSKGNKEQIYDYTVSGFSTDRAGEKTVTVTYASKTASFPIRVTQTETATMGGHTVTFALSETAATITMDTAIPVSDYFMVALYDKNHRFLGVERLQGTGGTVTLPSSAYQLAIFWLDGQFTPNCTQLIKTLGNR